MTPKQLRKVGETLFGSRWQTPLARSLGMKDASLVRKWLSGKTAMRPDTEQRIRLLMSHDEWVIGDGSTDGRKYIVHTRYPRFIARADAVSGLTYACATGDADRCEFIWSDKPPVGDDLFRLLEMADSAIYGFISRNQRRTR